VSGARSASVRFSRRSRFLRRSRLSGRPRLPRPGPRVLVAALAVLALAAGGWVWLRNSSLVGVQRVTVVGVSGRDARQIRAALVAAARGMTTLNVKMGALRTAVAPFPVVKQIHVTTDFPHRMRIDVVEQVPVAMVTAAGQQVPVSADGTLLHGASIPASLPAIPLSVSPGGTHVTGPTLRVVRLLAAAPYQLLAKVSQATDDGSQSRRQMVGRGRGAGRSRLGGSRLHRCDRTVAPGGRGGVRQHLRGARRDGRRDHGRGHGVEYRRGARHHRIISIHGLIHGRLNLN
jgi:cell division septal protein FtsQ